MNDKVNVFLLAVDKFMPEIRLRQSTANIPKSERRKPNKTWVDKGSESSNRSMKSWLGGNDIELYSTHFEEKPHVAETFVRTSKNKTRKDINSVSKNVYIDKLYNIFNKLNNTCHIKMNMKPINIKSSIYVDFYVENYDENPNFKVSDPNVSKYKNIFSRGYNPNWTYVISNLKSEEIVGTFYEKTVKDKPNRV